MKIYAGTDIGKAREMNQDSYYVSNEDDKVLVFILADGMGGYTGGEIASKMAVESAKEYITNNWNNINKNQKGILKLLKETTEYANKLILNKATEVKELKEMGTTMELCVIYENNMYVSHIGDSRIYVVSEEYIKQITIDDTYVEKLIEEGTITREEAIHHPDKHMLTKALGCDEIIEPNIFAREWQENESILICSDGLTNMLNNEEIKYIILNELLPEKKLIDMANNAGGTDNITTIIIKH